MNTTPRFLLGFLLSVTIGNAAWAEIETIGPTQIAFGQPLDFFYSNTVHPDPVVKEMSFFGTVSSSGAGSTVLLGIHFDYLDDEGVTHIVPAPNFYQNLVQPGAQDFLISAGPLELPFCPEQVSIHFELLDPGGIGVEIQGIFEHTCVPVPEPGTLALGGFGAMAVVLAAARRRRRARRRSP